MKLPEEELENEAVFIGVRSENWRVIYSVKGPDHYDLPALASPHKV